MKLSAEALHEARLHAQAQWNANPCGAIASAENDRSFFDQVESERYRQQYWQRAFFDFMSFKGRVLEIGIGLGTDLKQFARAGAECHGVDITDKHLSLTNRNFENEGLPLTLHRSDANKLPYPDNHFDCVYSFGVIHHIPDVDTVLDEVFRVLRPGGVFQVAVYHLFSIHTFSLFLRSIFTGRIVGIGISGVLATIESGADGVVVKPYVRLYSARTLEKLLRRHDFQVVKTGVRQVNFDKSHFLNFLRRFENFIGWYVCSIVKKPEGGKI